MQSFEERNQIARNLMTDTHANLSLRESTEYFYNWIRFEIAVWRQARSGRNVLKYGKRLNDSLEIFKFRSTMNQ